MYWRSSGPMDSSRYRPWPSTGKFRSSACFFCNRSCAATPATAAAAPDVIARVHFMSGLYPSSPGTNPGAAFERPEAAQVQEPPADDQQQPEHQEADVPRQRRAEVVTDVVDAE